MNLRTGMLTMLGLLCMGAIGCTGNTSTRSQLPWPELNWGHPATPRTSTPSGRSTPNYANPGTGGVGPRATGDADWAVNSSREWRYIVIHHSASETGNAAIFDAEHRRRGWDELGYHFVIDNGNGGYDGRVEVGPRWRTQKWGAHTGKTPNNEYNLHGIGICLVGDFTRHMPSQAQLANLHRLVGYLMIKYDIPPENVVGHRDAPGAQTECPGDQLWSYIHGNMRSYLPRTVARR